MKQLSELTVQTVPFRNTLMTDVFPKQSLGVFHGEIRKSALPQVRGSAFLQARLCGFAILRIHGES